MEQSSQVMCKYKCAFLRDQKDLFHFGTQLLYTMFRQSKGTGQIGDALFMSISCQAFVLDYDKTGLCNNIVYADLPTHTHTHTVCTLTHTPIHTC